MYFSALGLEHPIPMERPAVIGFALPDPQRKHLSADTKAPDRLFSIVALLQYHADRVRPELLRVLLTFTHTTFSPRTYP